MLTEEDREEMNRALAQGYEIHIQPRAGGPHIVAEKIRARVLRDGRKKGGGTVSGFVEFTNT